LLALPIGIVAPMPIHTLQMNQDHGSRWSAGILSQTGHQAQTTVPDIRSKTVNSWKQLCKATNF